MTQRVLRCFDFLYQLSNFFGKILPLQTISGGIHIVLVLEEQPAKCGKNFPWLNMLEIHALISIHTSDFFNAE